MLANADRTKLYVGISNNVWRRRLEHRQGFSKGYAYENKCFDVIYVEEFTRIEEALSREKQIKSYGRLKKIDLVKGANPTLESLKSPSELQAEWVQLTTAERAERIAQMGRTSPTCEE
jgi:putative endonuclease